MSDREWVVEDYDENADAPEYYGASPEGSCNGEHADEGDYVPDHEQEGDSPRGAVRSSYPARPGSVSTYGSASSRGWGSGWPRPSGTMKTVRGIGDDNLAFTVRSQIADLVVTLINYTEKTLRYDVQPGQTGGYNNRAIGGTSTPSNHSWGLALDINWQSNPMTSPFRCNMPPKMISAWWACGFYWGGWYLGTPDPMHFEYVGTPSTVAKHLAKARELLNPAPKPTVTTNTASDSDFGDYYRGAPGSRVNSLWDAGDDVLVLQKWIGKTTADGYFGPATEDAVAWYQKLQGLEADGVAGPDTWGRIL